MAHAQCTRCFGPLDRPARRRTFVERFTDSRWCSTCLAAWMLRFPGTPEPVVEEPLTLPQHPAAEA